MANPVVKAPMRISAPGCKFRAARPQTGFTLIELMIVILIISISVGMLSVNLGVLERRNVDDEVQRMQRVLQLAAERAAIRGTPVMVEFLPGSYRFSQLTTSGKWQLLFTPPEFAERPWIEGLSIGALSVNDQKRGAADNTLVFGSESPRFQLQLVTPEGTRSIVGNSAGEVMLLEQGNDQSQPAVQAAAQSS